MFLLRHNEAILSAVFRRHKRLERFCHARAQVRVLHPVWAAHEHQDELHQVAQLVPVRLKTRTDCQFYIAQKKKEIICKLGVWGMWDCGVAWGKG